MFDPNSLNTISKANTNRVSYDLRYSAKTEKFNLSDKMMDDLNMQNNGLIFLYDSENQEAFLGVVPEEDAVMMKGKSSDTNKGKQFTASRMREALDSIDIKWEKMKLDKVDTVDGVDYYQILPLEGTEDYDVADESEEDEQPDSEETPELV